MKTPFISIIIPTLNEEQFLPRLLEDIAAQAYRNFEVIVVDSRSIDDTKKRAMQFADLIPLRFYSVEKRNVSYQRNYGATKAQGRYLMFLDADIQIPPIFLEEIAYALNQGAVFISTYYQSDSNHILDRCIIWLFNKSITIGHVIGSEMAIGGNMTLRADIFRAVGGFDERVVHAEDYDITQKVRAQGHTLTFLQQPRIVFSLRRYRKEGRLVVLGKMIIAAWHVLVKGPITKGLFTYEMGGGRYRD